MRRSRRHDLLGHDVLGHDILGYDVLGYVVGSAVLDRRARPGDDRQDAHAHRARDATPDPSSTGASATPTPGSPIAGEQLSAQQAAALQQAVDQGHQPWRTDVAAVTDAFVRAQLGWGDAQLALADPHTAEVTHPADSRMGTLQLRQPAREGAGGIWVVVSGVWLV